MVRAGSSCPACSALGGDCLVVEDGVPLGGSAQRGHSEDGEPSICWDEHEDRESVGDRGRVPCTDVTTGRFRGRGCFRRVEPEGGQGGGALIFLGVAEGDGVRVEEAAALERL